MPSLEHVRHIFARTSSSNQLIPRSDIKQILSDALLSFSPLATLVGAESAYALAHRVTNFKQSFVVSIAPIGALGMMATVCKGANLPGLKDMLGVGDEDISDAARATGCGTLIGDAIPRMDKHGGLISNAKGESLEHAASAVVRLEWETGHLNWNTGDEQLHLGPLQNVVKKFTGATMTGRVVWQLDPAQNIDAFVYNVRTALIEQGFGTFKAVNKLGAGKGMIELHWPAPGMSLETNAIILYLYGAFFVLSFASIAVLAGPVLGWQSSLSSALLLGGQVLLALGHVAAKYIVQYRRETLKVRIPRSGLGTHWAMIDKPRFTSFVAERPYSFTSLHADDIVLSQRYQLKGTFVVAWHALLTLFTLSMGFLAFYVGGKSSDIKTVLIYIGLFVLANVLKGLVILHANKPRYTRLESFVHEEVAMAEEDVTEEAKLLPEPAEPLSSSTLPTYSGKLS
jgi:hypothetical protein